MTVHGFTARLLPVSGLALVAALSLAQAQRAPSTSMHTPLMKAASSLAR